MSKTKRIRLSFVPIEGDASGYYDCIALAPNGTEWKSMNNEWFYIGMIPKQDSPIRRPIDSTAGNPFFGLFGFFIALMLFARPVGMTFPSIQVGLPILLAISAFCGFAFYRIFR